MLKAPFHELAGRLALGIVWGSWQGPSWPEQRDEGSLALLALLPPLAMPPLVGAI